MVARAEIHGNHLGRIYSLPLFTESETLKRCIDTIAYPGNFAVIDILGVLLQEGVEFLGWREARILVYVRVLMHLLSRLALRTASWRACLARNQCRS